MKNLTLCLYDLAESGCKLRAQEAVKELGITWTYSVPQSMLDCWHFWGCTNVPEELPPYLSELKRTPQEAVGYGLSQEKADELIKLGA